MPVWDIFLPGRLYPCLKVILVFCGIHCCSWKWFLFSMPVWDLLLPGRLYHCLKEMLLFCGKPLVFKEMAFGQYASLGPVYTWKAIPLFKGNVIVLWYTTGVHGISVWSVCQSVTYYYLEGCTSV